MTADHTQPDTLASTLDAITTLAEAGWSGYSRTELAHMLAQVEDIGRQARYLKELVTEALVAAMGGDRKADIAGLGVVEVRGGRKRTKWDTTELARHIANRALVDLDTGELKASTLAEAADLVLTELVACAPMTPSMAWRVGALRDRDIDPDEWCESVPAPPTVQITRADS